MFALIGVMVAGWLIRRALTEDQQRDPQLFLLVLGAVVLAIIAGIAVGTFLR